MTGRILDLVYTDASTLYNAPPPTWVAGALLIAWRMKISRAVWGVSLGGIVRFAPG